MRKVAQAQAAHDVAAETCETAAQPIEQGSKRVSNSVRIGTEIAALLKMAFEAIWTPPGRLLVSILDKFGLGFGAPGVSKPSFKIDAVFTMISSAICAPLPPPWGLENQENPIKSGSELAPKSQPY